MANECPRLAGQMASKACAQYGFELEALVERERSKEPPGSPKEKSNNQEPINA